MPNADLIKNQYVISNKAEAELSENFQHLTSRLSYAVLDTTALLNKKDF